MQSDHKSNHVPARKLQTATLCPLVLGMAVCVVLTLSILYSNLEYWTSQIKSTLDTREKEHLLRLALSRSEKISSTLNQVSLI